MSARVRWLLRNRPGADVALSLLFASAVAAAVVGACRRPADSPYVESAAPAAVARTPATTADLPLRLPSAPTLSPPPAASAPTEPPSTAPLRSEDGERDPASATVTIAVQVEPPKIAHVFWGPKDLGVAPLEIKRPRASGPVDLIIRAPGFLTLHTRAFTDRNDRIAVRLIPETDAPRMFGYRSAPASR